MKTKYYNVSSTLENRKYLRSKLTPAEATLWRSLKKRQLKGRKFRRQFGVGVYILDFYCVEEKLCIELDGAYHFTEEGLLHDAKRDEYLKQKGIRVVHIENQHVFDRHEDMLELIMDHFNG